MIKTSFIIPTLNRQEDLGTCLLSLTKNTVLPDEVIIIEQWNIENTRLITERFKKKLNIQLLYSKEKSWSKARNIWIDHSIGELLFFIDDDVTLDKKYIEIALSCFKNDKNILWVTWKDILHTTSINYLGRILGSLFCISTIYDSSQILRSWHNTNYINCYEEKYIKSMPWCSMILRRNIFDEGIRFNNNFIRWSFWEDVYLSYRIYKKYWPKSLKYLPQLEYKHYFSTESRLPSTSLIRMKIIYRYIFWKNEVYDEKLFNLLCYLWSQVWLVLLETFYKKTCKHVPIYMKSYLYLYKNYKKIDNNTIDYNRFIIW